MDKTFQQLMTHVIDLCHVASNSSCEKVFTEFEKKIYNIERTLLWIKRKTFERAREGNEE